VTPPAASAPSPGHISAAALTNKAFEEYLARVSRTMSMRDTFMPQAVESCDRLASAGAEDPDSRAPRVPLDKIEVPRATRACLAAVLQEPSTARLRAQLARVLLRSPTRADKLDGLAILNDLAGDGSAVAMWKIAIAFASGTVLKKDMSRALGWFRSAADKGLGVAMSDLGYYYAEGDGVAKDPRQAVHWFERAAAVGHPGGMRNYALMLDRGTGIAVNPARAADFLLTAYRMGSDEARESLFTRHASWRVETRSEVQRLLRDYGFYDGPLGGAFDERTFAALRALSTANPVQRRD
jgi:TPR repeat protein